MAQVLITIDTEIGELGKYRPDAFEIFIEGKIDDEEVGYKFIMDILDKHNTKGEFFIDIYPYSQIGEDKFALLCQNIIRRGHNIQLHTHPSMAFDKDRIYMYQYALEEQIKVLELGKEKIKDWIGKYPIAHRAGGYGINADTFKALEQVGIYYDVSYLYGNENCKFQCNVKNKPFRVGNVIEIPIAVFKKTVSYSFFNINILHREYFQKLDIRYGATVDNIKKVINDNSEDNIVVLFLHSFNFLKLPYNFGRRRYGRISIDEETIKKFENLLKWVSSRKSCNFKTISKLKIDSFQGDTCMEVPSTRSVMQGISTSFTRKVLKIRKT